MSNYMGALYFVTTHGYYLILFYFFKDRLPLTLVLHGSLLSHTMMRLTSMSLPWSRVLNSIWVIIPTPIQRPLPMTWSYIRMASTFREYEGEQLLFRVTIWTSQLLIKLMEAIIPSRLQRVDSSRFDLSLKVNVHCIGMPRGEQSLGGVCSHINALEFSPFPHAS